MIMRKNILLILSFVILVAAGIGTYFSYHAAMNANNGRQTDESAVRFLVNNFGRALNNVALLSPSASGDIERSYGDYLVSDLLTAWENDPSLALGRITSSPRPDRIEIANIESLGVGAYEVSGDIIEVTSAEEAGGGAAMRRPVDLTVIQTNGRWLIANVTAGSEAATEGGGETDNNGAL
jgi:hypothetical protein